TRKTEQEVFWETEFGNDYILRNQGPAEVASSVAFFSKIISKTTKPGSVLELGSNIGVNLAAMEQLLPDASLSAVEINREAAEHLERTLPRVELHCTSILEFEPARQWDLVFSKGVLIHLNPQELPRVYDLMFEASSQYIMVAEYYNPIPVELPYRGHEGKLFKRDFAGELMDRHSTLTL
ncbi:MAG: methyltransferase domain-containing protein, partial [Planctomycetaceae bacterium]|nr:methyltransferase domain-containing protein [Planctomycetaceae bacterium]